MHQEFLDYQNLIASFHIDIDIVPPSNNPDAIYLYDVLLPTPWGFIILQSQKPNRIHEATELKSFMQNKQHTILGQIQGEGYIDGGDIFWLSPTCLAMGLSWRSNQQGAAQLQALLTPFGIEVRCYDIPNLYGESICLHLMSLVSLIRSDLAVVCKEALPIRLYQDLSSFGYQLLSVPQDEWDSLGCNVLSLGNDRAISLAGNPKTAKALRSSGIELYEFQGPNICRAGTGGPTCLTMVRHRD